MPRLRRTSQEWEVTSNDWPGNMSLIAVVNPSDFWASNSCISVIWKYFVTFTHQFVASPALKAERPIQQHKLPRSGCGGI